ncbi:sugar nucleotide-binding protein [Pseudodesulfovibrio sp.]|uniref:SDR family oxidoreductase n=1 Tax=Pseudodesulfovibrio sp. TaxID=2035812 RepID=UPI00261772C6|nr:sugar nucleotide-binding protein [Pseudodesulfovibrio sp.]MDD3312117.1 sugar nucleotide-binding protein [Pseudodesulfovibrio sp.]
MQRKRPLVVGADGTIAAALIRALEARGQRPLATTRSGRPGTLRLDLTEDLDAWTPPADVGTVFLCAALTSTALCRTELDMARRVNVDAPALLARRVADAGGRAFFLSTNLVFDGSVPAPAPDRPVCPRTVYGRLKADAEARILALGESGCVLRLSKVIQPGFPLFASWLAELRRGKTISPFADMRMAPVSLDLAVRAIVGLDQGGRAGIRQLSAPDDISYARAASLLREAAHAPGRVRPESWKTRLPDLEHVPDHTTLDSSLAAGELGLTIPASEAVVARAVKELQ